MEERLAQHYAIFKVLRENWSHVSATKAYQLGTKILSALEAARKPEAQNCETCGFWGSYCRCEKPPVQKQDDADFDAALAANSGVVHALSRLAEAIETAPFDFSKVGKIDLVQKQEVAGERWIEPYWQTAKMTLPEWIEAMERNVKSLNTDLNALYSRPKPAQEAEPVVCNNHIYKDEVLNGPRCVLPKGHPGFCSEAEPVAIEDDCCCHINHDVAQLLHPWERGPWSPEVTATCGRCVIHGRQPEYQSHIETGLLNWTPERVKAFNEWQPVSPPQPVSQECAHEHASLEIDTFVWEGGVSDWWPTSVVLRCKDCGLLSPALEPVVPAQPKPAEEKS